MNWIDQVQWDAQGLVPVIAQEAGSGDVLMFAWMNREALQKTAELGRAVYFSRALPVIPGGTAAFFSAMKAGSGTVSSLCSKTPLRSTRTEHELQRHPGPLGGRA